MLDEIRLANLGVIAEAVLPLAAGLTVLTGETGAGKTMLLSALDLLCGGRADAGLVRPGATRATAEGRLRLDPAGAPALRALDAGAELDGDTLIVHRTVGADGRSRAILGGVGVPNGVLAEVVGAHVVVHGQADQQRLASPAQQREILDRYAGQPAADVRAAYAEAYEATREATALVDELESASATADADIELLQFGVERVISLAPKEHEDAELDAEIERLSHAESLADAVERAHGGLTGAGASSGETSGGGGSGAEALLAIAARDLSSQAVHDPALKDLADRMDELTILAGDLRIELAAYRDGLAADPSALERANERLAALRSAARIYSPQDPTADGLRVWQVAAADRLSGLLSREDRLAEARERQVQQAARLLTAAESLRAVRIAAGARLSALVGEEFAGLALTGARLEVGVEPTEPAAHGSDAITFSFTAHPGAPSRPIGRGASGGELSRIMLALEVVLAGADPVPTMVFDEVDAGVGGQAAVEVGARLSRLARHHQVLVVTHLPQVAAFADQHVRIRKDAAGGVGVSDVDVLAGDERVIELARMLGGQSESDSAREHARELVAVATGRRHSE